MLGKLAILLQSKAAIAVVGVVLVGGTGATVAAVATGHTPFTPTSTVTAETDHDKNADNQGQNEESIEGTLKGYDAAKHTIVVFGEHEAEKGATGSESEKATPSASATSEAKSEATAEPTHAASEAISITVTVDSKTKVNGEHATSLADLTAAIGHKVEVQAEKQSDGTFLARKVTVEGEGEQDSAEHHTAEVDGTVSALGIGTFTVKADEGKSVTVTVNAQTLFKGALHTFADLKQGVRVAVKGAAQSDGSVVAAVVSTETESATPGSGEVSGEADLRGSVVSVGANSFVMASGTGKQVTVNVAANTQYSGGAHSLSDLKAGSNVEVHGAVQTGGSVAATEVSLQSASSN